MAIAMIHSRPLPLSARSSHLRTSHLPAHACSTGLFSHHVLRAQYAVRPAHLPTRLVLLPTSPSNGSKIDGDLHAGGDGCGSGDAGGGCGGGRRSGKPGSGDEDDRSGEVFAVPNRILKMIRRWLKLGESLLAGGSLATIRSSILASYKKLIRRLLRLGEQLLAGDLLATIHSEICIPKSPSSSHSTPDVNLMEDEGIHCDGSSNDQLKDTRDNHSHKCSRTISKRNKFRTRTAQQGTRTNNTQDHDVDIHISDDETSSDKNEKMMKGRRSYVLTMATFSQAGALFLVPYSVWSCSNTTLSIPKVLMDVLLIGYVFLLITVALVTSHSSQFKDGELPDNAGFKLLQILYAVVLVCLLAGLFIPLHVCRGMSNLVVWTSAAGALLMIAISWSIAFHHKTVINCIKAPCQMVIKWTKNMYEKVQSWMPNVSLSECIKAKFKKMPEEKSYPGLPMEPV